MHLLLIVHVALLGLSLIVSAGLITAHLLSRRIPVTLLRLNFIGTFAGLAAGGFLLLTKPLSVQCLFLLCYLIAFSALHAHLYRYNSAHDLGVKA